MTGAEHQARVLRQLTGVPLRRARALVEAASDRVSEARSRGQRRRWVTARLMEDIPVPDDVVFAEFAACRERILGRGA